MAGPINRKNQKTSFRLMEIFSYLAILFVVAHVRPSGMKDFMDLEILLEHMLYHPLDIFPLDKELMTQWALMAILVPLYIHAEFLRRRDLRPAVENGSARWNEDLKGFYAKYAESSINWPHLFDLPILRSIKHFCQKFGAKIDGRLSGKAKGKDGKKDKKLLMKIYDTYQEIYASLTRPMQTLDKTPGPKHKNMIFSKEVYMSMDTRKTRRNNNVLVIGGSGTGKSRFIVKPNLLQANCSYVITDPSGELLETMGGTLEEMGYEVRVFNLVQMEHSNCYNPFHYIRNQQGVLTMLTALIKNTTPKESKSSDPFWEKAETALLQAICFFLQSECNPEDRNFSNVMKLLRCASAIEGQEDVDSTLDILFKDLEEREPEHIAVQSYKIFKSVGGGKTAQTILISCQVRLQCFNLDAIKSLTNTDDIDLGSIGDKPVALFCTTSVNDTAFNFLVSMMYTQLFETLYFHAETQCPGMRLPYHVRFLLDEFANIGTIPDFPQKLSTMRKYEISCTIIIQALSQIKAMYKDDWEVLVGNCDTVIFLGGADATSLEYISKKLGKETIRAVSNSRSYGRQGSFSQSFNKTGRELLTDAELGVMDNDNCIVFIRGLYPFFATKYPLEQHPNYHLSGDADKSKNFDVKKRFHTGKNTRKPVRDRRNVRVWGEAQKADTRTDRQHKIKSRPVEKVSEKGEELATIKPFTEVFPYSDVPEHLMTEEQMAALAAACGAYTFEYMNVSQLPDEVVTDYQCELFESIYSMDDDDEFEEEEVEMDSEEENNLLSDSELEDLLLFDDDLDEELEREGAM